MVKNVYLCTCKFVTHVIQKGKNYTVQCLKLHIMNDSDTCMSRSLCNHSGNAMEKGNENHKIGIFRVIMVRTTLSLKIK